MPNEDMALESVVHKEVDVNRDLRLDAFQPESLRSLHDDFGTTGFLDEVIEQETVIDPKKHDSVKSKVTARGLDRSGNRSSSTQYNIDVVHNSSKDAFQSMDSQVAVTTGKEMKTLQMQKSAATKKPSGPDVQSKSSTRHRKKKRKEDLNEILKKRLDKLEAKLNMIGAKHLIPDSDDSGEDVSEEKEMADGRRTSSQTSRTEKKRKAYYSQDGASDSKFAKRRRTVDDDDLEKIIAANVNGSTTDGSGAKLDEYSSSTLTKNTNPGEGNLLTTSADFSDEMISMIESQCWEYSQDNEFGNAYLSLAPEQLTDTETIMYNILSQNLPGAQAGHVGDPASDSEIDDAHNAVDILPQTVGTDTFILPRESEQPELEKEENDSEHHEDSKHLGCLSVDTQWDSQFVESFVVKSTHLSSVHDWRSQKLLDLLISGRLKEIPSGMSLELQNEGTDNLVASSLQNILSNLSWLWSVAVGDDMLSSVQDVVSSTSNNLDSLTIDFVENSGCVDIPVSMSLISEQRTEDISGKEVAAEQEDGSSCEESQLLESLSTSLDTARQKVLNQTEKCSVTDVTAASAASFGSLLEHAINSSENADADILGDLYSPTRPTEVEHALFGGITVSEDVDRSKGLLDIECRNEVDLLQSADVTDALNELIGNSAPTRRTVRIHKKEDITVTSPSNIATGAVHKDAHGNFSSRVKGAENLGTFSSQMSYGGLTNGKTGILESSLSVPEELPVNWSVDLSNIAEIEVATDDLPSKLTFGGQQLQDVKSVDKHIAITTEEFDSSVDNQHGVDSLASQSTSQQIKSSKKHSSSHDQMSNKSASYHGGIKKDTHSRKHKDSIVDVTSKRNRKKPQDVGRMVDQQLKLDVRSELKHIQKGIESLLYDKYGITIGNASGMSRDVSLHNKHFPDLSGLSFDARVALMSGENKTDNMLKAVCSTPLLSDLFTELNIQLPVINLSLQKNSSAHLTDRRLGEKLSVELSDANILQLKSPSSPPLLRKRTGRQSSASRRSKSKEEAGVKAASRRQQEPAVTENEKRLMKADKLMQTFRRSQLAKRQSQKTSPKPPASFIRQVQTVTPSEELESVRSDIMDTDPVVLSSEVKEPDFSTVITDGNMLASVELPHVPPKMSSTQNDDADTQTLSPKLPDTHRLEAVPVSITPAPRCESTMSSSAHRRVSSGGKEQRVYVFNSDRTLCRQVEVSFGCLLVNYENRPFVRIS